MSWIKIDKKKITPGHKLLARYLVYDGQVLIFSFLLVYLVMAVTNFALLAFLNGSIFNTALLVGTMIGWMTLGTVIYVMVAVHEHNTRRDSGWRVIIVSNKKRWFDD